MCLIFLIKKDFKILVFESHLIHSMSIMEAFKVEKRHLGHLHIIIYVSSQSEEENLSYFL